MIYNCDLCRKEIYQPDFTITMHNVNPLDNQAYFCQDCAAKIGDAVKKLREELETTAIPN